MKNKKIFLLALIILLPSISFAADNFGNFLETFLGWVKTAGKILYMLLFLAFFWGLVKFLFGGAEDQEKGKSLMIWGIVAIFVVTAIWGIIGFIKGTFGISDGDQKTVEDIVPGMKE